MARKKSSDKAAAPIDAVRHKDKRKNIPTEELRDFVRGAPQEASFVELGCRWRSHMGPLGVHRDRRSVGCEEYRQTVFHPHRR